MPTLKNIVNRWRRSNEIPFLQKQNHCTDAQGDEQQPTEYAIAKLGLLLHLRTFVCRSARKAGTLAINWRPIVVQCRCLQNNTSRAGQNSQRKDPQKQAVQHHCHILPVLFHLRRVVLHFRMLGYETHAKATAMHGRRTAVMRIGGILVDGTLTAIATDQHVVVVRLLLYRNSSATK